MRSQQEIYHELIEDFESLPQFEVHVKDTNGFEIFCIPTGIKNKGIATRNLYDRLMSMSHLVNELRILANGQ